MTERLITVVDFDNHEVRRIPMSQERRERDEGCRSQGHYFATGGAVPEAKSRCVCGDITFDQWGAHNTGESQESEPKT